MPIAFDATCPDTSAQSVASLTSGSWTVAGSNRAVFGCIGTGAGTPTTHTAMRWRGSAGDLLAQIGATLTVNAPSRLSAWGSNGASLPPAAEANTAYGLWAATQDEDLIAMVSYTGVHQTTPNGSSTTNTGTISGTSGTATVTIATTAGDVVLAYVLVDCFATPSTPVLTPASSADGTPTERHFNNANVGGWKAMGVYEMAAVDTSTIINVSITSVDNGSGWGVIAFVINAAAASGQALDETSWHQTGPQTNPLTVSVW